MSLDQFFSRLLHSQPRYLDYAKWSVLLFTLLFSLSIAVLTPLDVHPDEYTHVQAFTYFQGRFFPPAIGSNNVWYDRYGLSRVYYKELVYIIYGNLGYCIKQVWGLPLSFITYRIFNVVLFGVTLYAMLFTRVQNIRLDVLGFGLVCIPQITYLYSYANSDAWAFSWSLFLFIWVAKLCEKTIAHWQFWDVLVLGLITGLILTAKPNFYLTLLLPYALIFAMLVRSQWQRSKKLLIFCLTMVWVISILGVAAPLQIVYPLSQGDYHAAMLRMREEKAAVGAKPSHPKGDLQLQDQGYSYSDLLAKRSWIEYTAKSFWGYYGYFRVASPTWMYQIIFYFGWILLGLSVYTLITCPILFHNRFLTGILLLSPIILAINIIASLHNSLAVDYQPQGRYLFPSYLAIAIWLIGLYQYDRPDIQRIRKLILGLLYVLAMWSLGFIALPKLMSHHQFLLE